MRYRDLKQERDDAIARAVEAERMSMKSEFERVTREFEEEKTKLAVQTTEEVAAAYQLGFEEGHAACEAFVVEQLKKHRESMTAEGETEESELPVTGTLKTEVLAEGTVGPPTADLKNVMLGNGRGGIDDGFDLDDAERYE